MKKNLLILSKLLNHENAKITAAYLGLSNPLDDKEVNHV